MARIIRKYGNRRLYDTAAKRYVNLDEIAQMIREGEEIEVQDATNGNDLTRGVLTQIIMDETKSHNGGLPIEMLRELVALSDRGRQGLTSYLHSAMETYRKAQHAPVELVKNLLSPLAARTAEPAPAAAAASAAGEPDPVEELRRRVEELERQLQASKDRPAPKAPARKAAQK
ncbi:MAG TPA: pesticin [Solibacterales bacterium]|nr:pesticin [Bryobacterales bacterium]